MISSSLGSRVLVKRLLIEIVLGVKPFRVSRVRRRVPLSMLLSSISIIEGGTIRLSAFEVVTALAVSCVLQLQCSTAGSVTRFTAIMAVLMTLAEVVSSVLIVTIDSVRLLCSFLKSPFTVASSDLVTCVCLSTIFTNMNSGIVSRAVPFTALKTWPGRVVRKEGLKALAVMLTVVKVSDMLVRASVIGQFSSSV